MKQLTRKNIMVIGAVIDIALHATPKRPVSSRAIAARHNLPARYLEPALQSLTRVGLLKATRGPSGGYEIAREGITAEDILRAAESVEEESVIVSPLLDRIMPTLARAEESFVSALSQITLKDLTEEVRT
jgi:Rrf2 family protein